MKTETKGDTQHCESCSDNRAVQAAELMNSKCFCVSLQDGAVKQALKMDLKVPHVFDLIEENCPHLFSARPVFVSASQTQRMAQVVLAIESVVAMPAYRDEILGDAPDIVRHDPGGAKGVFFGYDFHLNDEKLGLIEVNTNAGGAMLNAVLARAQHACCGVLNGVLNEVMHEVISTTKAAEKLEASIVEMFKNEWHLSQQHPAHERIHKRTLRTIAIVDEAPAKQFLYPEFLLFQQLFQRHGFQAIIADPSDLQLRDGALWHGDIEIDVVYNRLTDFLLEAPGSKILRDAYLANAVVLTPHPQAHALFADKRNLVVWSNPARLQSLGVPPEIQKILLENIPHTEQVLPENTERLWAERRTLFFKPNAGFGGRAAYRGDKLTKRVWQEIMAGDYIAQSIVTPGERVTGSAAHPAQLKFDLRNYTYDGVVQWVAARTYQGQTTNFRTPGGGFAPVYSIDDGMLMAEMDGIQAMISSQMCDGE